MASSRELERNIRLSELRTKAAYQYFSDRYLAGCLQTLVLEQTLRAFREGDLAPVDLFAWYEDFVQIAPDMDCLDDYTDELLPDGTDFNIEPLELHTSHVAEAKRNAATSAVPEPFIRNPDKPTKRDLERRLGHKNEVFSLFATGLSGALALKRVHLDILESVISQFQAGDIDAEEFTDWVSNWINQSQIDDAEEALTFFRKEMGIGNLTEQSNELEIQELKLLVDHVGLITVKDLKD